MSERFERWKAREKIQSDIGWVAVYCGLAGALNVVFGVLAWLGVGNVTGPGAALAPVLGVALLAAVRGLWSARPWARWLFVVLSVVNVVALAVLSARDGGDVAGSAFWALVSLGVAAYLLLPATGLRFARASGVP